MTKATIAPNTPPLPQSRGNSKIMMMLLMVLVTLSIAQPALSAHPQMTAQEAPSSDVVDDRLILTGDVTSPVDLTNHVASFIDTSRALELGDILALPESAFAQAQAKAIPSFGYTSDIVWHRVRLSIEQPLSNHALLEITPSYLNFIDVFLLRAGESTPFEEFNLGDHIPSSERTYGGRTHVASLPLLEPGDYDMYVRIQSNSANWITMNIWPAKALISSLSFRNLAINFFFGFCLTLGLAYLTLGLIARDKAVVLYGIWVLAIGTVTSLINGIALSELRPEIPWMNDVLIGITNVATYGMAIFLWLYIIEAKKHFPTFHKICCVYGFCILAFAVGTTSDFYTVFGSYIVPSHALFMAVMCVILIMRAFGDNRKPLDLWYLVVLAIPTAGGIIIQLALSGVIDATPMRMQIHQFTLVLHLVGAGILMTVRLASMDKERVLVSLKAEETTTLVAEQRKLISMLSHEFRTPLAVIQRSSEMLMLQLANRKDDALERLQRIQLQARKLARLVDIFLTKDGIDSQEMSLDRELVSVDRFLQDFAAQTTREGAGVAVVCHNTGQDEILIDKTLMGLAITNLIETSRRFSPGSPITIDVRQQSDMLIEISIPCQGEGLEEDDIILIRDALITRSMEANSMRRALGLHVSKRIVEAHGGSIVLRKHSTKNIELCLLLESEPN